MRIHGYYKSKVTGHKYALVGFSKYKEHIFAELESPLSNGVIELDWDTFRKHFEFVDEAY